MKKTFTLITAFLLAAPAALWAQTGQNIISGQVVEAGEKKLEATTIALLQGKDSSLVKYAVADASGRYQFDNLKPGTYLVAASATGYGKKYSEKATITEGGSASLKTLTLSPEAKVIAGVTVTANKPLIEQKIDRTVVNVEASVTNAGSNALEVLEKAPGVSVDKDGNISLKGKEGVMVLVDGRPTQLGAADLANMLRNMNASQLEQVEIMTNPPAKYDAAGNAGIINIKTKKLKQFGFNGSVNLGYGQGRYPKYNEGVNLNYRKGKVNVFANLSHNHWEGFQQLDIQRNLRNENTKVLQYYFDQNSKFRNTGNSYNVKTGVDYSISKNTTVGIVAGTTSNPSEGTNRNQTKISNGLGKLEEITTSRSGSKNTFSNFTGNVNFRHQFDTTGRELTADVDYLTYNSRDDQFLSNYYADAVGNNLRKGDTLYSILPQDIKIWTAKTDYLKPLKKGARFEAGLKTSIVHTDNNARFDTVHNGKVVYDKSRSNHFVYRENVNAAYANLSGSLAKKWNGQLGLRMEHTHATGRQRTTGEQFNRDYISLFPTAFVQYAMSEKNNFGLNYGRRIRRPNYQNLNPFIEFIDRYTFEQGNPDLKPQFSHNVELSHTYNKFLTTTLNYTSTTDIIQEVIEQNTEKKEVFVKRANIASARQMGLAVSLSKPVTKWWTTSVYVNASNNRFEGVVGNAAVVVKAKMIMLNGSQQFKLSKTWSAELSGWYRTKGIEGVIISSPMGALNVGIGKQIMKNKGSLRLNVRDVLYTQQFRAQIAYGNVDAAFQNKRDSRVANLTFTYRFSKGKLNGGAPKRKTGGANDEAERVGGGN
jgi:iron complex outermembrane recepter protein